MGSTSNAGQATEIALGLNKGEDYVFEGNFGTIVSNVGVIDKLMGNAAGVQAGQYLVGLEAPLSQKAGTAGEITVDP